MDHAYIEPRVYTYTRIKRDGFSATEVTETTTVHTVFVNTSPSGLLIVQFLRMNYDGETTVIFTRTDILSIDNGVPVSKYTPPGVV